MTLSLLLTHPLEPLHRKRLKDLRYLSRNNQFSDSLTSNRAEHNTNTTVPNSYRHIFPTGSFTQYGQVVRHFGTKARPYLLDGAVCKSGNKLQGRIEQP